MSLRRSAACPLAGSRTDAVRPVGAPSSRVSATLTFTAADDGFAIATPGCMALDVSTYARNPLPLRRPGSPASATLIPLVLNVSIATAEGAPPCGRVLTEPTRSVLPDAASVALDALRGLISYEELLMRSPFGLKNCSVPPIASLAGL